MTSLVSVDTGEVYGNGPLARLEAANQLLAEAETVDEVKDIRDKAEALRLYSKQAGYGLDMQNRCAELKLRAERRAGELLTAETRIGPGRKSLTLTDLGLTANQSSRWQRIAAVPEPEFEAHIAETHRAERELTTASVLKLAKQNHDDLKSKERPLLPEGVYRTIVADPPWQYGNTATRGAAEDHYPTMTIADLCALDIAERAADEAHLYIWTTNGFLRESFDVMEAWGFTYKTLLTWVKPQMGMGNYFRLCTEHVLFGIKGGLGTQANDMRNWFEAPRGKHSAKPESFYDLVEKASPGPYLEMFARRRRLGWENWGNEA